MNTTKILVYMLVLAAMLAPSATATYANGYFLGVMQDEPGEDHVVGYVYVTNPTTRTLTYDVYVSGVRFNPDNSKHLNYGVEVVVPAGTTRLVEVKIPFSDVHAYAGSYYMYSSIYVYDQFAQEEYLAWISNSVLMQIQE